MALAGCVGAPVGGSSASTTAVPVATSTQVAVPSSTSATAANAGSCADRPLGLDPAGTEPGPVRSCLEAWDFTSALSLVASSAVAGDAQNAEAAYALLGEGPYGVDGSGFFSLIPAGWADRIVVTRNDGEIHVHLPHDFVDIDDLGTTANNLVVLGQLYGTAFSDPTITLAHMSVEGDAALFCGRLDRAAVCGTMTRGQFFSGGWPG
jgi:hypothetical protein